MKPINLNTSLQSLTSQCTIDSLAKRVQKLVGPVDYKKSQPYTHHTICNKPSSYGGSGGLAAIDASRHSMINYDSIYKELDSIQDTLRGQTTFNKHLDYEVPKYQNHNESITSLNSKYKELSKYDFLNVSRTMPVYDEKNSYFEEASKNIKNLKSDLAEIARIKTKQTNVSTSPYKFSETLNSSRDQVSKNYLTTSVTRLNSLSTPLLGNSSSLDSGCLKKVDEEYYEKAAFNSGLKNLKKKDISVTEASRQTFAEANETLESSHSDSDDAKGPKFPANVYGSNSLEEEKKLRKIGIYGRQQNTKESVKETKQEEEPEETLLDSDYLKRMDKKLKKLIKKNLSRDLKSEKQKTRSNPIAWDIPTVKEEEELEGKKENEEAEESNPDLSVSFQSHPYLPLKNVPMHDIVKKLQREFEIENECKNLPGDMNRLWNK